MGCGSSMSLTIFYLTKLISLDASECILYHKLIHVSEIVSLCQCAFLANDQTQGGGGGSPEIWRTGQQCLRPRLIGF